MMVPDSAMSVASSRVGSPRAGAVCQAIAASPVLFSSRFAKIANAKGKLGKIN